MTLFRAKSIESNKWVYGFYVRIRNASYIINGDLYIPVQEDTLGQFVGYLDEHKTKIFEGDIVFAYSDITYNGNYESAEQFTVKYDFETLQTLEYAPNYEIVGNIYDDKNLTNSIEVLTTLMK